MTGDEHTEEVSVTTPDDTEAVEAEAFDAAADAVDEPATEPAADAADAEEAPEQPAVKQIPAGAHHLAQTVGRRKEAIVRVRLLPGSGKFTLNGKSLEDYFPNKVHQQLIREPLVTVDRPESFDVIANLRGGGTTGQAGALRLAIARALIEVDADDRPALKKARKAPQYSKR